MEIIGLIVAFFAMCVSLTWLYMRTIDLLYKLRGLK